MKFLQKNTILLLLLSICSFNLTAQTVRIETILGNIDIELRPDVAPVTVANFLKYVNDGDYNNSYIHRSVNNFVIQGGGFNLIDGVSGTVPLDSPIVNESSLSVSNVRGTIAMARTNDVNSATSQWYINIVDNTGLDGDGNGYAVFGSVVNGMDVVDLINSLREWDIQGGFQDVPLLNFSGSGSVLESLVMTPKYSVLGNESIHINPGLNGSWYNLETAGSGIFIDVLPTLDAVFVAWFTHDVMTPTEGDVATIGDINNRWLSGFGTIDHDTQSITFDLTATSGGLFDSPQTVTHTEANSYGTMKISFQDCENAHVEYNLIAQELSGDFPLIRLTSDNVALCQSLSLAIGK